MADYTTQTVSSCIRSDEKDLILDVANEAGIELSHCVRALLRLGLQALKYGQEPIDAERLAGIGANKYYTIEDRK